MEIRELWEEILSYLEVEDIKRIYFLNKQIYSILRDPSFWKRKIGDYPRQNHITLVSEWIKEHKNIEQCRRKVARCLNDIASEINHGFSNVGAIMAAEQYDYLVVLQHPNSEYSIGFKQSIKADTTKIKEISKAEFLDFIFLGYYLDSIIGLIVK